MKLPSGPDFGADGRVVCCDSDHDSLPEILFSTGITHPSDPVRIEDWEHQGWNRFKLVYCDTGSIEFPEPNGITTGNAFVYDAGDLDGDGLTDILCTNNEYFYPDSMRNIIMTLESPAPHSYPCSLSWYYQGPSNYGAAFSAYFAHDLDRDGRDEILGWLDGMDNCILENVSNDSNELKWTGQLWGYSYALRDFDCDGWNDVGTGWFGAEVWENTGDDQYEMVWQDTFRPGNGSDCWSTADIDGDGRPEFYMAFFNYPRKRMWSYMYEDESDGSHQFTRTLVDSLRYAGNDDWGRSSAGGDIDGDGIDECIWTTYDSVRVYKAYGNNDLRKVWDWSNDHVPGCNSLTTTVYDVNNDGYNELLVAGNAKISIFEVEAVTLLSPNSGSYDVGDTVPIRWAINTPPRCDSLSLFLRRDSLWHLQPIATGLPATVDLYRWVVPSNVPDTGRIVVIAYGPGWQFDMSDSAITFIGGGIAEGTRNIPLQWSLSVSPNPARGAFTVRYDVPDLGAKAGTVPQSARTRGTVPVFALGIYDVGGRLVRSLSEGAVAPGRYETRIPSGVLTAGVYFVRLEPWAVSRQPLAVTKVVVSR